MPTTISGSNGQLVSVSALQQTLYITATSTGGSSDAITATFSPAITALPAVGAGVLTLMVRAAAANTTTTPTFTPNSGVIAAETIVKGAGIALAPGDIAGAGHWLILQRDATLGKWVLLNPATGVTAQQPGEICFFARNTAPTGFLKANGAAVSRTTYAALFAAIGTTFGAGDGSTTFNLPDLRGEFLRGFDDGRGIDSGRVFGSRQAGSLNIGDDGNNVATLAFATSLSANYGYDPVTLARLNSDYPSRNSTGQNNSTSGAYGNGYYNNDLPYWGVTRPRNVALLACIKY